jgi:putative Holliday junction resolvase
MTKSFPGIEIKFYDERFTSKIAMQNILGSGIKKMKRRNKEALDKIAAVIILQDYLKSEEFQRPSKT